MKKKWLSLGPAQQFIIKSVSCVALWRLLYVYVLKPLAFPDKILTRIIGEGTIVVINLFSDSRLQKAYCVQSKYWSEKFGGEVFLYRNNHILLRIGDACNGLELMLIYAGVIALLPGSTKRKGIYISVGILCLIIANFFRCAGLQYIYVYFPQLFETTHHYVFTLVMYVLIFIGWVMYINKVKQDAKR